MSNARAPNVVAIVGLRVASSGVAATYTTDFTEPDEVCGTGFEAGTIAALFVVTGMQAVGPRSIGAVGCGILVTAGDAKAKLGVRAACDGGITTIVTASVASLSSFVGSAPLSFGVATVAATGIDATAVTGDTKAMSD
jgi:hypothetical protein